MYTLTENIYWDLYVKNLVEEKGSFIIHSSPADSTKRIVRVQKNPRSLFVSILQQHHP